jgi:predicted P-loop ATPase
MTNPFPPAPATCFGATTAEWDHWAFIAGVDLLPAIGDPNLLALPRNPRLQHLESLAKTPSILGYNGVIRGIAQWVAYQASATDVDEWKRPGYYNILLNTRNIRALDIDVADRDTAYKIASYVRTALGVALPLRWREDSGKCTLLMRLDPHTPMRKRVIHVKPGDANGQKGAIEWLANGQQTLLMGTHPNGARMQWADLYTSIPTVPLSHMIAIWDQLRLAFEADADPLYDPDEAMAETVIRNGSTLSNDPVARYLEGEGMVTGIESNGTLNVRCPWEHEHSDGPGNKNSTSWLPAGLGGKEQGGFRCLHAHCISRKTHEFLHAVGFAAKEATSQPAFNVALKPNPVVAYDAAVAGATAMASVTAVAQGAPVSASVPAVKARRDEIQDLVGALTDGLVLGIYAGSGYMPTYNPKKPGEVSRSQSTALALLSCAPSMLRYRFDEFALQPYLTTDGERFVPLADEITTDLVAAMDRMTPACAGWGRDHVRHGVWRLAKNNSYDSAINAVKQARAQWDGQSRIASFAQDVLHVAEGDREYGQILSMYLWLALAARALHPGTKADITPILISARQATGKSTLVRELALLPEWHGVFAFKLDDAENCRQLRGKIVVEMAELHGLHGAELEQVKQFMTREVDEWTPKYVEETQRSPRRTIGVGTSNHERVLQDPTGNRRWAPIHVAVTAPFIDHFRVSSARAHYWGEAAALIEKYPSPQDAVEEWATKLRLAAIPHTKAALIIDPISSKVAEFLAGQRPGSVITFQALALGVLSQEVQRVERGMIHRLRDAMANLGHASTTRGHHEVWVLPQQAPGMMQPPPPFFL